MRQSTRAKARCSMCSIGRLLVNSMSESSSGDQIPNTQAEAGRNAVSRLRLRRLPLQKYLGHKRSIRKRRHDMKPL
jgi:hypothetical protein